MHFLLFCSTLCNLRAFSSVSAYSYTFFLQALNANLGGCSLEQEGGNFYITGADAVRKKLGNLDFEMVITASMTLYQETVSSSTLWGSATMQIKYTYKNGKGTSQVLSRSQFTGNTGHGGNSSQWIVYPASISIVSLKLL